MKSLIAVFFLISATALAQSPPRAHFPWWEGPFARGIGLTEDQENQIQATLREHRNLMIDQRAATEKAEAALEDLFNDPDESETRASEVIDRLVSARSDMTRTFTEMSFKLRQTLTDEQWRKLQKRSPRSRRPDFRKGEPRRPMEPGAPQRPNSPRPRPEPPAQDL